jgi:hypothetical protein
MFILGVHPNPLSLPPSSLWNINDSGDPSLTQSEYVGSRQEVPEMFERRRDGVGDSGKDVPAVWN